VLLNKELGQKIQFNFGEWVIHFASKCVSSKLLSKDVKIKVLYVVLTAVFYGHETIDEGDDECVLGC
jgi:hypothetical protein